MKTGVWKLYEGPVIDDDGNIEPQRWLRIQVGAEDSCPGYEDEEPPVVGHEQQWVFLPAPDMRLFKDLSGDGCHWGPFDMYPENEAIIRAAVAEGLKWWDTGWFGCKKEIHSFRVSRKNRTIRCEASVSDDFDTEGIGAVSLLVDAVIPDEETVGATYERIMEGLQEALGDAEEDRKNNQEYQGFCVGKYDAETGRRVDWEFTYIAPKGGGFDRSHPPGDAYQDWGWQEFETGLTQAALDEFEEWAKNYALGDVGGETMKVVGEYCIEPW